MTDSGTPDGGDAVTQQLEARLAELTREQGEVLAALTRRQRETGATVRRTPQGDIDILNPDIAYVNRAEERFAPLDRVVEGLESWRLRAVALATMNGFQEAGPAEAAEALLVATRLAYKALDALVSSYSRALALVDLGAEAGFTSYEARMHEAADALADLREYIDSDPGYERATAEQMVADITARLRALLPHEDEFVTGGQ